MAGFFDVDIGIGGSGRGMKPCADRSELEQLMNRYGLAKCLAYDLSDVESGIFCGIDHIVDFCAGSERILPTIPVAPPATHEGPPPAELVELMLANHVAAVRVFPRVHGFDLLPWSMGSLLETLQEHRIPLIYHSGSLGEHPWPLRPDWEHLYRTATAFPDLPIVVLWIGMLQNRRLYPLLEQCANVVTDQTSVSFQYVEDLFERFGPNRLVMGSHHPYDDPGIYTTLINYAGLTKPDRENLAHGCVEQLLEAVR